MPIRSASQGFLVVADITGYTAYLSHSELEHAQDVLMEDDIAAGRVSSSVQRSVEDQRISSAAGEALNSLTADRVTVRRDQRRRKSPRSDNGTRHNSASNQWCSSENNLGDRVVGLDYVDRRVWSQPFHRQNLLDIPVRQAPGRSSTGAPGSGRSWPRPWTVRSHPLRCQNGAPRVGLEPTTNGLTVHTAQALCSVA